MNRRSSPRGAGRRRFARASVAAFAALALVGAASAEPSAAEPEPEPSGAAGREIGAAFTLVDQEGRTVTERQYLGKWLLVYFGYTHCPDACPTALGDMDAALEGLGPERRARVQPLFITVDPERDTPPAMKDYLAAFEGVGIVGLTGTVAQVRAAAAAYRVRSKRYDLKDGDYAMSHPPTIHIVDPGGRLVGTAGPARLAEHLAKILP